MQRALGRSMSIDVAYVGSRGDHLPVRVDINQLDPQYLSLGSLLTRNIRDPLVVAAGYTPPYAGFNGSLAQALRPFPQFPNMFPGGRNSDTRGTSTYDALQVKFDKRYSAGRVCHGGVHVGRHPDECPEQLRQQCSDAQECLRSRDEPGTSLDLSTPYPRHRVPLRTAGWYRKDVSRQHERARQDYRWLAVEWNSALYKWPDARSQCHANEPGLPRRSDGRGNRRQHRNSADCGYRFWGADDVGYRELRCADGSLSQPSGIRPADGSVRLIDAHDRRVARVCFAERGPGHFEDDWSSGPLNSFRFAWRCSTRSIVWNLGFPRATSATRKHSGESPARPTCLETCRLH